MHSYIDANTTLATQKAMALNIFAVCMKEGNGIIEACAEAAKYTGFNAEVVRRWAETIFRDFFLITANIDNISDEVWNLNCHQAEESIQSGFLSSTMKISSCRQLSM